MNQYKLNVGDVLHIDYNLSINGVSHSLRLSKLMVEEVSGGYCTLRVETDLNSTLIETARAAVDEGLIAYAEKKGGFLSAKEMRRYLDKQKFIENLKDPK
jgi:hypothetical protein